MYKIYVAAMPEMPLMFQMIDVEEDGTADTISQQWFAFAPEAGFQLMEIVNSSTYGGKIDKIIVHGNKSYAEKFIKDFKTLLMNTDIEVEGVE